MTHNGSRRVLVISEGDQIAQVLPDGTVAIGEVMAPKSVGGKARVLRPNITWGDSISVELVRSLADKMKTETRTEARVGTP